MLDLLIINGHVIDPFSQVDSIQPVVIYNGKITKYEEGEPAKHTIDATGRYVFPGLIDAHAHMFAEGTDIEIYPDFVYLPTGVTSAMDATAGVSNYRMFRSVVIERGKVTIKSFPQMCSAGLVTISYHECVDPKYFNAEKTARVYEENKDNILGLKIGQSEELAMGFGIEPLKAAVTIADKTSCPVEVHCTNFPVPTCEVLEVLRPGDIFEYVYQGVKNTIIDENGKPYEYVRRAWERGIWFDTAEGRKHGDYDVMKAAVTQGFIANICSTNLVLGSMYRRTIFSLPNPMSRYICMGIPMRQVVQMTTSTPARLMKMTGEIGCLSEEARADVAIFDWEEFHQTYRDWKESASEADHMLEPELTIKDDDIVYCAVDYIYEPEYQ